jgi:uncharacterized integral membrane protein
MHRLFGLLAVMAAGLGVYVLFADTAPSGPGKALDNAPVAYSVWALGLLMGLTLAWLASINWSTVPARIVSWARLQRRRLWLALLGGICAGILVLF